MAILCAASKYSYAVCGRKPGGLSGIDTRQIRDLFQDILPSLRVLYFLRITSFVVKAQHAILTGNLLQLIDELGRRGSRWGCCKLEWLTIGKPALRIMDDVCGHLGLCEVSFSDLLLPLLQLAVRKDKTYSKLVIKFGQYRRKFSEGGLPTGEAFVRLFYGREVVVNLHT